jgi:hypothetical protein
LVTQTSSLLFVATTYKPLIPFAVTTRPCGYDGAGFFACTRHHMIHITAGARDETDVRATEGRCEISHLAFVAVDAAILLPWTCKLMARQQRPCFAEGQSILTNCQGQRVSPWVLLVVWWRGRPASAARM